MARKVLLVDDSTAVRKAVEATLEPQNFKVFPVAKGKNAIQEAKRVLPDVVLMDSVLDEDDGYRLCRRFKDDPELQDIPVILLTAEGDGPEESKIREARADGHLAKPFQGQDLMAQVSSLVDLDEEPTVMLDTDEIEVLDFGDEEEDLGGDLDIAELELEEEEALEGDLDLGDLDLGEEEALEGDLDLGALELEEEEALELTDEVEAVEEDVGATTGFEAISAEEEEERDLELPAETVELERTIEGRDMAEEEEVGEISFEEELEDLDLSELALDSTSETLPSEEDLGLTGEEAVADELARTEDEEIELDLDEGLTASGEEEAALITEEVEGEGQEAPADEVARVALAEGTEGLEGLETGLEEGETKEDLEETHIEQPQVGDLAMMETQTEPISLEETTLEEEVFEGGIIPAEVEDIEFPEVPLDELPYAREDFKLEITEADLGVVDPFSEEGIRHELARNLQEMAERVLSDLAPPIVERVAREVALERTEKIVLEEIQRLKTPSDSA